MGHVARLGPSRGSSDVRKCPVAGRAARHHAADLRGRECVRRCLEQGEGRQLNNALAADCAALAGKKDVGLANCVVYALLPIVQQGDKPTLDELVAQHVDKAGVLSWSSLMPDKLFAIAHFANLQAEDVNRLMMPFGKAVQKAYSYYSGVSISGQPTRTHHAQLHAFEKVWARAAGVTVLDINSGLHEFGMQMS